ncbi:hypothetical protein DL771_005877 [Monosporascus sp. 5C6A]|nr:hypothetical protein DL771_005877 [Monosporascus sp. 5C6A]
MRLRCLFLVAILGYEAVAKCVSDGCFRGVTVETATRTTLSTILVTATSKTTDIPNESVNDSRERRSQQLHKHEVVDGSVTTTSQDGLTTAKPSTIPAYASVCPSSQAYESACSCLGIASSSSAPRTTSRVVAAASQAVTAGLDNWSGYSETSTRYNSSQLRNTTRIIVANATALFPNSTSQPTFSSSASRSSQSLSLTSSGSASFTNTWRFSSPTKAGASSSVRPETLSSTVSSPSIGDAVFTGSANNSQLFSGTSTLLFNVTSTGRYSNGTTATASSSIATTTFQAFNGTSSVPYMNTTRAPTASITQGPFLNTTHSLTMNATTPSFSNTTSSGRFTNTTSAPAPTATSDDPCGGQISDPFTVQVAQPEGMFDGWFLRLSAAAIIFAPTEESATRFGIASEGGAGGGGHLCTQGQGQGRVGSQPLIAVAENGTDVTGGAVYFVDAQTLAAVGGLGYAALRCSVAGEELACAEGAKRFWVACGLGLDITSDGDGVAEIGGWNCTAVALSPVYS